MALELGLAIGLLVFPITILVVSLPTWVERQSAARVAAQEAAREVVLADSWGEGTERGVAVAQQTAANHGVDGVAVSFSGSLERGAEVAAHVTVKMPALVVPGIGRVGAWSWTVTHTEQVDLYR
ncbi:MAG: hypothetical protein ACRDQW_18885, partial [Haloechinothrix sp.]